MLGNWIRPRLTYANVMVTVLAFIVLGGGAVAATKVPKKSVGPKQLKANAVTGPKVKDGSLSGADIDLSSLGAVPAATNATNATQLGGVPASAYQRVRWAIVNENGVITAQSGGIENDGHDLPGNCTPGCDYLDFGSPTSGKAIIISPKLSGGIDAGATANSCGEAPSFSCTAPGSPNHVRAVTTNAAGAQADRPYYIALIG